MIDIIFKGKKFVIPNHSPKMKISYFESWEASDFIEANRDLIEMPKSTTQAQAVMFYRRVKLKELFKK